MIFLLKEYMRNSYKGAFNSVISLDLTRANKKLSTQDVKLSMNLDLDDFLFQRGISDSENRGLEFPMKSDELIESSEDACLHSDSNSTSQDTRKRRRTNHDYRRLSSSGYLEEVYGDYNKQRYSSESSDLAPSPVKQRSKSLTKYDGKEPILGLMNISTMNEDNMPASVLQVPTSPPILQPRIIKKDGSPLKIHIKKADIIQPKSKKRKHHRHHHHHHHRSSEYRHPWVVTSGPQVKRETEVKSTQTESTEEELSLAWEKPSMIGEEQFPTGGVTASTPIIPVPLPIQTSNQLTQTDSDMPDDSSGISGDSGCVPDASEPRLPPLVPSVEPQEPKASPPQASTRYDGDQIFSGCHPHPEFGKYLHVDRQPNGGASVLHVYSSEIAELGKEAHERFVGAFFDLAFRESTDGVADHVLSVIHGAVRDLPDPVGYFSDKHPGTSIKSEVLGKSDILTRSISDYREEAMKSYSHGLLRAGPMLQMSIVGTVNEEVGGYFKDFLDILESNPFVKHGMPWGPLSSVPMESPSESNDGPILWVRPGEQMVPTADMPKTPKKKRRGVNELRNLQYLPRVSGAREVLVEDRTRCHADHVGQGFDRLTTAAGGILKGIQYEAGSASEVEWDVKDVVAFHADSFTAVAEKLQMDLHEPPVSQCVQWVEEAKLNQLRREGVRYAQVRLRHNDVYFIPRNIVHQFKTVRACSSIAWHLRHRRYHADSGTESTESSSDSIDDEEGIASRSSEDEKGAGGGQRSTVESVASKEDAGPKVKDTTLKEDSSLRLAEKGAGLGQRSTVDGTGLEEDSRLEAITPEKGSPRKLIVDGRSVVEGVQNKRNVVRDVVENTLVKVENGHTGNTDH